MRFLVRGASSQGLAQAGLGDRESKRFYGLSVSALVIVADAGGKVEAWSKEHLHFYQDLGFRSRLSHLCNALPKVEIRNPMYLVLRRIFYKYLIEFLISIRESHSISV